MIFHLKEFKVPVVDSLPNPSCKLES